MSVKLAIEHIFAQVVSINGLTIPKTFAALHSLNITRYHIDFAGGSATTYKTSPKSPLVSPENSNQAVVVEVHQINIPKPTSSSSNLAWSKDGVVKAFRRVQAGETKYNDFAQECVDSGVVGYMTFLTGKSVLFYGSGGEMHVEGLPEFGPTVD